ncbi:hypothetical protein VKT23_014159 [Stygiomarasmius scandens]|uniref:Replication termination factor 2 n=1 Tax=Marasmiellus scandens TaxID=2682957 RepID=A0ABR1J414_9AGAR
MSPNKKSYSLMFSGEKQARLFQIAYEGFVPDEADIKCPLGFKHRLDVNLGYGSEQNFGKIQFACKCRSGDNQSMITWMSSALTGAEHGSAKKKLSDWEQELKARQKARGKVKKPVKKKTAVSASDEYDKNGQDGDVDDSHQEEKIVTKGRGAQKETVMAPPVKQAIKSLPEPFPMSPPAQHRSSTGPSHIRTPSPAFEQADVWVFPTPPATSPIQASLQKGKRRADTLEGDTPKKRKKLVTLGEPIDLTMSEEKPEAKLTHSEGAEQQMLGSEVIDLTEV